MGMKQKNIKTKGVIKMKKIGIAVFALMFVGVAYVGAQEIGIDFDGTNAIQNADEAISEMAFRNFDTDLELPKAVVSNVSEEKVVSNSSSLKSLDFRSIIELQKYYVSQDKIKKIVSKYYTDKGNNKLAKKVLDRDIRIMADDFTVHIIKSGNDTEINDAKLAMAIGKVMGSKPQQKIVTIIAGAAVIINCMTTDSCWDAVGDGVSAVSEWANS